MGSRNDVELLDAWSEGDVVAGNELAARHFRTVFRFFRRRAPHAAEDLTQRTFLASLEARKRAANVSSFRAYLLGVARNQFLMFLRRNARGLPVDDVVFAASEVSPSGHVARQEEQLLLVRALRRIPVDLQIAVELFYLEQMSNREIADVLKIPLSTVTSRLSRARECIREQIRLLPASPALRTATINDIDGWVRSLEPAIRRSAL